MSKERNHIWQDYQWLVEQRTQIQKLILEIYNYGNNNQEALLRDRDEKDKLKWSIYHYLVGASFSLWRAVFLVDPTNEKRKKEIILKNALLFLQCVIKDNAINYPQDRDMRDWSMGYYLNNARLRLNRVKEKFECFVDAELVKQTFSEFENLGGVDETSPQRPWEITYLTIENALGLLKNQLEP